MYNIKVVSKMLGIPPVTLRAWERRYGVAPASRTETGHRLYSESDVEDLRWLKERTEEMGLTISHAVQLLKQHKQTKGQVQEQVEDSRFVDIEQSLYQALLSFDSSRANHLLDYTFSLFHHETAFHEIIVPLFYRIGQEWKHGNVSVAQEHFSSQLIMERCAGLGKVFVHDPGRPKVLSFCPVGEHHQMGLMLFNLFLRQNGVPVIFLGMNTPLDGLVQVIKEQQIQVVCMSATNQQVLPAVKTFITNVSDEFPGLQWVLGGQAFFEQPGWEKWVIGNHVKDWKAWFERTMRDI